MAIAAPDGENDHYAVRLHNDDVHTYEEVIHLLSGVLGTTRADAVELTKKESLPMFVFTVLFCSCF